MVFITGMTKCFILQTFANCSISGKTGYTSAIKRARYVHTLGIYVTFRRFSCTLVNVWGK